MAILMSMATRAKIMGPLRISRLWSALGWLATAVMGAAALTMLVSLSL
jgi:hypothetical protein